MKMYYIGTLINNVYYVYPHCHDCWEIVYYTSGSGQVNIDGKIVPFETGDIFAIPPNVPHFDSSDHGFRNYHYNFYDSEFNQHGYLKLHDGEGGEFLILLKQMYTEYHFKRENWENIVDSLYEALKNYIYSFLHHPAFNPYVSGLIKAVIDNLSDSSFDISKRIAEIPLNPDYFRKLFCQQTGKTPLNYLLWKRMRYAEQLLNSKSVSHLSIKEIAWICGYDNYYYFSRQFKSCFGKSPRAYLAANVRREGEIVIPRAVENKDEITDAEVKEEN